MPSLVPGAEETKEPEEGKTSSFTGNKWEKVGSLKFLKRKLNCPFYYVLDEISNNDKLLKIQPENIEDKKKEAKNRGRSLKELLRRITSLSMVLVGARAGPGGERGG